MGARRLNCDEISSLREIFVALDADGDGSLSYEELKVGMSKLKEGKMPEEIERILDGVDDNWTGTIDYTEFLASSMDRHHYQQESVCRAAFHQFDRDHSGKISKSEMAHVLHNSDVETWVNSDAILAVLKECDKDGDGE